MKTKLMRMLSLCLVLVLAAAFLPQMFAGAEPPAPYGDLNGDGRVRADDARIALQAAARIVETTDTLLYYGDIDGDGKISSGDARRILRAAAKLEALPERSPGGETEATTAGPTAEPEQTTGLVTPTAPEQTTQPAIPTLPEQTTEAGPAETPDLRAVYSAFAVKLLKAQYAAEKETGEQKNVMISPLSVMTALAMAQNGARGNTLAQFEALFGVRANELDRMLSGYLKDLPQTEKSRLIAANSVWIRNGAFETIEKDFLDGNREYYNAEVYEEPFDGKTCDDINGWCKKNTDGMIEKIIDEIPFETVMYLIDALTFDAEWAAPFEKNDVGKREFTNVDGTKTELEMMYGDERTMIRTENAEGFVKAYDGGKYKFATLLPDEGTSVGELIAEMDENTVARLFADASTEKNLRIGLPKFKSEYDCEMSETLKTLGLTDAFNADFADLSGIGTLKHGENAYISKVIHKTFVSVDEQGTRAAAVTAIAIDKATAVMDTHYIILDRPFVYMIVDGETDLPVFIGVAERM